MKLNIKCSSAKGDQFQVDLPDCTTLNIACLHEFLGIKYGLSSNEFTLVSANGFDISKSKAVHDGDTFMLFPKVLGGKGGFGSLLRSFGKQITKSTNKDACRDLTGRRIKHVNNEKRVKDFLNKQSELAKQKEEEKQEKLERRRKKKEYLEKGTAQKMFIDPEYDKQMEKISSDINQAISNATASSKKKDKSSNERKRKLDEDEEESNSSSSSSSSDDDEEDEKNQSSVACTSNKDEKSESSAKSKKVIGTSTDVSSKAPSKSSTNDKFKDWMGVDIDVSSSDDDESDDDEKATTSKAPLKKSKKA